VKPGAHLHRYWSKAVVQTPLFLHGCILHASDSVTKIVTQIDSYKLKQNNDWMHIYLWIYILFKVCHYLVILFKTVK